MYLFGVRAIFDIASLPKFDFDASRYFLLRQITYVLVSGCT
jgi:hypothetical protein